MIAKYTKMALEQAGAEVELKQALFVDTDGLHIRWQSKSDVVAVAAFALLLMMTVCSMCLCVGDKCLGIRSQKVLKLCKDQSTG